MYLIMYSKQKCGKTVDNPNSNCVPRVCFIETDNNSVCKPNPCKNGGTCEGYAYYNDEQINVPSYECSCAPGWRGNKCDG